MTIERTEWLTFIMASFERERGSVELSVECRIWHEHGHGMMAEPLRFSFDDGCGGCGKSAHKIKVGDLMSDFVRSVVASELDSEALEAMLADDIDFAGVRFSEPLVSGNWYRRTVL